MVKKNGVEKNSKLKNYLVFGLVALVIIGAAVYYFCKDKGIVPEKDYREGGNCDVITNADEKSYCLALEGSDESLCADITGNQYDEFNCYKAVAVKKLESSPCDFIDNNFYKYDCYSSVAVAKKDITVCDGISVKFYKDQCYSAVQKA